MYYLLPFRFHVMHGKELLINDLGDFLVVPRGSVGRIVNREIDTDEELYKDLSASFFISEQPLPRLIDTMAVRLATRKAFLDHFTALHIFVLTLRCNQNCIYCQASSKEKHCPGYDMEETNLFRAIDLMFCSPSPALTLWRCTSAWAHPACAICSIRPKRPCPASSLSMRSMLWVVSAAQVWAAVTMSASRP